MKFFSNFSCLQKIYAVTSLELLCAIYNLRCHANKESVALEPLALLVMADLRPGHASDLAAPSPSLDPSSRHSSDDGRSQDGLLSRNTSDDNLARNPGDSVPDAPPRLQEVSAENPTHATNRQLG